MSVVAVLAVIPMLVTEPGADRLGVLMVSLGGIVVPIGRRMGISRVETVQAAALVPIRSPVLVRLPILVVPCPVIVLDLVVLAVMVLALPVPPVLVVLPLAVPPVPVVLIPVVLILIPVVLTVLAGIAVSVPVIVTLGKGRAPCACEQHAQAAECENLRG